MAGHRPAEDSEKPAPTTVANFEVPGRAAPLPSDEELAKYEGSAWTPAVAGSSGGSAATAQVVLFESVGGNGQAITDGGEFNLVVDDGITGFPTSDNAADFIATNGSGESIFARECLVFGQVQPMFTDNDVAADSLAEFKLGPSSGDRGTLGSGTIPAGESQGEIPLFAGRAAVGDSVVVVFQQPGGAANVFYVIVKLWLVG